MAPGCTSIQTHSSSNCLVSPSNQADTVDSFEILEQTVMKQKRLAKKKNSDLRMRILLKRTFDLVCEIMDHENGFDNDYIDYSKTKSSKINNDYSNYSDSKVEKTENTMINEEASEQQEQPPATVTMSESELEAIPLPAGDCNNCSMYNFNFNEHLPVAFDSVDTKQYHMLTNVQNVYFNNNVDNINNKKRKYSNFSNSCSNSNNNVNKNKKARIDHGLNKVNKSKVLIHL